jgi:hypothetical protein
MSPAGLAQVLKASVADSASMLYRGKHTRAVDPTYGAPDAIVEADLTASYMALAGGGGFLVLMYAVLRVKNRRNKAAQNLEVVIAALALWDFGTDGWFVWTLQDLSGFTFEYSLALWCLVGTTVLNAVIIAILFTLELRNKSKAFSKWLGANNGPIAVVIMLSTTKLGVIKVLQSQVIDAFHAPWSPRVDYIIIVGGLVMTCLEDVPQLHVQFRVSGQHDQLSGVALVTIATSCATIALDVLRKLLVVCSRLSQLSDDPGRAAAQGITANKEVRLVQQVKRLSSDKTTRYVNEEDTDPHAPVSQRGFANTGNTTCTSTSVASGTPDALVETPVTP